MHARGHLDNKTMEYLTPEDPKQAVSICCLKFTRKTIRGDRLYQPMVTQLKRYRNLLIFTFGRSLKTFHHTSKILYYQLLEENGKFNHSRKYHACYHGCNFPLHEHSPWWRNCRMQKNMGTTNSSRTSDRMFSGDAYTGSKKNNNFTFDGNHYLQINGTAMGTKMAPSYANIFMGDLEERLLLSSLKQPLSWFWFIDDVDMKWTHGDKELDEFLEHANSIHPSIKFTHEVSKTKISFLILPPRSRRATWQLIYTLNPQTNINTFHPVVAILRTVLRVSHSAKPLG